MLSRSTRPFLRFTRPFFSFPKFSRGKLDWEALAWETQEKFLASEKVTHLRHNVLQVCNITHVQNLPL
jgi:hypothetical protein